jgi:raffinose/stachyose/melibiose transport system permease protein
MKGGEAMDHIDIQRETHLALEQSKSKKKRVQLGSYVLIYTITFIVMIPFLWMILLSFKTNSEILNSPFSLPDTFSLHNYQKAIETLDILLMYKNTFIIAGVTIVGQIIITFMSSFALSRMVFKLQKLKSGLHLYLLLGLAIPPFILLFPVYRLTIELGLMNTHASLVLPYIATSISFNTLLFIGFLKGFPKELEEAAIIDGCNLFSLCRRVVFPMIKPVVATIFIFNILYVWNEFPFAVTLISDDALSTIPLGISEFKGRWSIDYGGIIAASILIMIPQLVFFGFFQKYIIEGMTAGAVKG